MTALIPARINRGDLQPMIDLACDTRDPAALDRNLASVHRAADAYLKTHPDAATIEVPLSPLRHVCRALLIPDAVWEGDPMTPDEEDAFDLYSRIGDAVRDAERANRARRAQQGLRERGQR